MRRFSVCIFVLILTAGAALADEPSNGDAKLVGGMSIVGNDEAPKSLAIVPWKESRVGEALDFTSTLGDGREPVDKDVFMRELDYYKIRVGVE